MRSDISKGEYINGLKCERSGKKTEDMDQDELIAFVGMLDAHITQMKDERVVHPPVIVKNDSVLIPKNEWLKRRDLFRQRQCNSFDVLWDEHERQTEGLLRMQQAIVDGPPVVLKTIEDEDVVQQRVTLDKAIELLEICSKELFFHDYGDVELEGRVDAFLKECRGEPECDANCTECKNCPPSLKPQAD